MSEMDKTIAKLEELTVQLDGKGFPYWALRVHAIASSLRKFQSSSSGNCKGRRGMMPVSVRCANCDTFLYSASEDMYDPEATCLKVERHRGV